MKLAQFPWPAATYYFEQPWTLDDVTYVFTMRFNLRVQGWFMDVADVTGAPLVSGLPLLAGRDLLQQYPGRGLPAGLLFVYDPSGQDVSPGQEDFLVGHRLIYASRG